jgi:hypothetical protein
MTTIAQSDNVQEALFFKSLLESNGIKAYLPDEFTAQNLLPMMLSSGVKVQVEDEDAEAARAVLAQKQPT